MSKTKETRLLMETWRKFLNEEEGIGQDPKMEDLTSVFRSRGAQDDDEVFWDEDEGEFQMITDDDEKGHKAEIKTISHTGDDRGTYSRTGNYKGSGEETILSIEEFLKQYPVYTVKNLEEMSSEELESLRSGSKQPEEEQ